MQFSEGRTYSAFCGCPRAGRLRRVVTFLFTDIEGSTRRWEAYAYDQIDQASTTRAIINGVPGNTELDIDLMTAIAEALGVAYGCVTASTTVTSERETKAQFFPALPQLWAVAGRRHHPAAACAIRRRCARGGQQGNTSQPIALPLGEQALHDRRTTDRYAEVKVIWVGGGQHSDQPARREYHSTRLAHED
jgi:hypothetical protein